MAYSFDGTTKVITLSGGTTSFSVRDIWSRWVDWFLTSDNSKYLTAFSVVGGDDIDLIEGTKIPIYAFLTNGWKIKPQEANHTLKVQDGILLVDGGGDPFVNTSGSYIVRINYQQPVQAISFSTGGGGGATPENIADAVWQKALEGAYTAEELIRILTAVLAGRVTGAGSGVEKFRDIANTKDRVTSTVDDNGNRTNIVLDGGV
jgi:hypothetical protein